MPDQPMPRVRDDILTAQLESEAVLLDLKTKRYYRLNSTAARVWEGIEDGRSVSQIVDALVKEFEVDRATAQAETERALEDFRARGLTT
jgi:acetyl/propionyl-CoA carboxylase alpha subunit